MEKFRNAARRIIDSVCEEPFIQGLHYDDFNFKYLRHGGWWWRVTRYKKKLNHFGGVITGTVYGVRLMPDSMAR